MSVDSYLVSYLVSVDSYLVSVNNVSCGSYQLDSAKAQNLCKNSNLKLLRFFLYRRVIYIDLLFISVLIGGVKINGTEIPSFDVKIERVSLNLKTVSIT